MIASAIHSPKSSTEAPEISDPAEIGKLFVSLLGQSVAGAAPNGDGSLRLSWPGPQELDILDSFEEFESYTISVDGETLIVV